MTSNSERNVDIVVEVYGSPSPDIAAGVCLFAAGWFFWSLLYDWHELSHPYKYISAYYYYLIVVPLKFFSNVWQFSSNLTSSRNLNFVFGAIAVSLYGMACLPFLMGVFFWILKKLKIQKFWAIVFFGPALISLLWFLGGIFG